MSGTELRAGRAEESGLLSDLALRSKAYWGYDDNFLAACRDELTLGPDAATRAVVATIGGEVVGFHLLDDDGSDDPDRPDGEARLEMLFVDRGAIGSGVGRILWRDACERARARGAGRMVLDADPGAEGFYLAMGARRVGETPSESIPGRTLPVMAVDLQPTPPA